MKRTISSRGNRHHRSNRRISHPVGRRRSSPQPGRRQSRRNSPAFYAQNSDLARIERLKIDSFAPEDVAIDKQDRIYCGAADGPHLSLSAERNEAGGFCKHERPPAGIGI